MDIDIQTIALMKKDLSDSERLQFDAQLASNQKKPSTALIISLFLGGLGIDRFYIGDIGLGIGKMLTLGGLGVWAIVDWFLIMQATRRKNNEVAKQIHDSLMQLRA